MLPLSPTCSAALEGGWQGGVLVHITSHNVKLRHTAAATAAASCWTCHGWLRQQVGCTRTVPHQGPAGHPLGPQRSNDTPAYAASGVWVGRAGSNVELS